MSGWIYTAVEPDYRVSHCTELEMILFVVGAIEINEDMYNIAGIDG